MKEETLVTEYAKRLSDQDLQWLFARFQQRIGGDLEEACDFIAQDKDMDRFFAASSGAEDWYAKVDLVSKLLNKETIRRAS